MKKRTYVLGVAVMLAGLLALPGVATSAMWVGGEIGANFNSASLSVDGPGFSRSKQTDIRPSVLGGVTLGYDFVNAGFGGYAYPDWMKYFSFALDFTYNRLPIQDNSGIGQFLAGSSRINGTESVLTFLFMAHYGFMPDSEVPSGRINPYIGVGPAIAWTSIQGTLPILTPVGQRVRSANFGDDNMNVALVVEPGVRFMCLSNVSVDVAMRFRYAAPSWSDNNFTVKGSVYQFTPLIRANYHF
jgi:opacity protein-like surface antigen